MRNALIVMALGIGALGCGPLAPPGPSTPPPLPAVVLPTIAPIVGAWHGADGTGWSYALTIANDGAFDQWIARAPGDRCHQTGSFTVPEPEGEGAGENVTPPRAVVARVMASFNENDCNPNFAGGGANAIVRELATARMVLVWSDATITFTRDAATR